MVFRLLLHPTGRLCPTSRQSQLLAILLESALPSLSGIASFSLAPFVFFILFLLFQSLFYRYEHHVQEGGNPDFDQYLFTLVDLLDFLQDPDDDSVPLRERHAGSSKAAQDKREQAAQA